MLTYHISQVNYEKLAAECGMTNIRSASNAWTTIKKKIMARGSGGAIGTKSNGTSEDSAATPMKSTPKKRAKKPDADDAEAVGASPAKKAKTPKKSKAKVDEDGEDEKASEATTVKEERDDEMDGV